jgi:hypothetical protein
MAGKEDNGKDDELGSFKIADKRRPEVRSSQRLKKKDEPEPTPSVGFPSIESRLEGGTIEDVANELRPSYEKLEELAANDPKQKGNAKKAMIAYERCADLMEYLFETKEALRNPPPAAQ